MGHEQQLHRRGPRPKENRHCIISTSKLRDQNRVKKEGRERGKENGREWGRRKRRREGGETGWRERKREKGCNRQNLWVSMRDRNQREKTQLMLDLSLSIIAWTPKLLCIHTEKHIQHTHTYTHIPHIHTSCKWLNDTTHILENYKQSKTQISTWKEIIKIRVGADETNKVIIIPKHRIREIKDSFFWKDKQDSQSFTKLDTTRKKWDWRYNNRYQWNPECY